MNDFTAGITVFIGITATIFYRVSEVNHFRIDRLLFFTGFSLFILLCSIKYMISNGFDGVLFAVAAICFFLIKDSIKPIIQYLREKRFKGE